MFAYNVGDEGTPSLLLQVNAQSDVDLLVDSCDFKSLPYFP